MTKPAVLARTKSRHNKPVQTSSLQEAPVQPDVLLPKERARACVFQDRFQSAVDDAARSDGDLADVPVAIKADPDETSGVASSAQDSSNSEFTTQHQSNPRLAERMLLLNVVGHEAEAIKRCLNICRKIAEALGREVPSFEGTLGMQFRV